MKYSPWISGRNDYWDGRILSDNPYDIGTDDWESWREGWWISSDEDMTDDADVDNLEDY